MSHCPGFKIEVLEAQYQLIDVVFIHPQCPSFLSQLVDKMASGVASNRISTVFQERMRVEEFIELGLLVGSK